MGCPQALTPPVSGLPVHPCCGGREWAASSRGGSQSLLRAMQPLCWPEEGANVCWSTVLAWGCCSGSRSVYWKKPLWYWDVFAVMISLGLKERLQREMQMLRGPSGKGAHLSHPLAFLLTQTCDSCLSSLQPLEPFQDGWSSDKV